MGFCPARTTGRARDVAGLKDTTSRLIGHFVSAATDATRDRWGAHPATRFTAQVVVPTQIRAECVMLKAINARFVRLTDARSLLLRTQREMIQTLVRAYTAAPERLDPLFAEDFTRAPDDDARLRVLIDQVASLTDPRAIQLAQEWR